MDEHEKEFWRTKKVLEETPLLEPTFHTDGGPWCEHNMPCAVCGGKHAVYLMHEGIFEPCCDCKKKGWLTIQLTPRWIKFLKWCGVIR